MHQSWKHACAPMKITLEVDRSCFARVTLDRDGTKERIFVDVELKERIPRKVGIDGSIYHLTFLYREAPRRSRFPCCMLSGGKQRPPKKPQQQQQHQQDYREVYETEEEQQRLHTANKWVLRFMRQPGTFPRFYELRTLPENWVASASTRTPLTSFASKKA
ncbi:hypothetical protein Esti_002135 [Eimeria stiedai]